MPSSSSSSFLRQISKTEAWRSTSKRWGCNNNSSSSNLIFDRSLKQMEGFNMYGNGNNSSGLVMRKRVMVVVDHTSHSKHAMMWALTHVANKGDLLTLLHIVPPIHSEKADASSPYLANSLGSLCKACKPEVEVEALVIQGPKLATVMNQVKKLDVSVLVLGQKKPSPLITCLCGISSSEGFVEKCIKNVECLTIGVSKQSKSVGGYLISTRWRKNFWLLA
ncbi:uncharacterized protein LOC8274112 [Ricinus communis]|uniref:UspA domain-containing protein n=1 Tax=Ricinus communis TaxID=3988 RepID=B9RJ80_RICCO|nr:uncharacterized protein LOC8274112 [Ricinus communis]EEF48382.1 conserved hypothetical protein [Ricinus communis]|eukprot:XP_002513799.1 uncharacterized protein LOC8274112 [Ricinus communis]